LPITTPDEVVAPATEEPVFPCKPAAPIGITIPFIVTEVTLPSVPAVLKVLFPPVPPVPPAPTVTVIVAGFGKVLP
jgi:hypothetical protein